MPAGKPFAVNVAAAAANEVTVPAVPVTGAVPNWVVPFAMNVMVPVGAAPRLSTPVPPALLAKVAVMITF
jgi:hypothetical protein